MVNHPEAQELENDVIELLQRDKLTPEERQELERKLAILKHDFHIDVRALEESVGRASIIESMEKLNKWLRVRHNRPIKGRPAIPLENGVPIKERATDLLQIDNSVFNTPEITPQLFEEFISHKLFQDRYASFKDGYESLQSRYPSLNLAHIRALNIYTKSSNGAKIMNFLTRCRSIEEYRLASSQSQNSIYTLDQDEIRFYVLMKVVIDDALASMPETSQVPDRVYRYAEYRERDIEEIVPNHILIPSPHPMSCSKNSETQSIGYTDANSRYNVKFQIMKRQSLTKARAIDDFGYGIEDEVLFPSNTQFRVLSKNSFSEVDRYSQPWTRWEITLEEI